jgi:hypothetical protein
MVVVVVATVVVNGAAEVGTGTGGHDFISSKSFSSCDSGVQSPHLGKCFGGFGISSISPTCMTIDIPISK